MFRIAQKSRGAAILAAGAAAGLAAAGIGLVAGGAQAAPAASYQRGPDPTTASVTAATGPFAVSQVKVPAGSGQGFADGTIFYPTDTSQGTFGAVAVMPGFLSAQSSVSWYGPRLASQGFVVFTLDSQSLIEQPGGRAEQLMAALTYLTTDSAVRDRVDPNRLAVIGWSMGGGGALEDAADATPALKAAVALAPWDLNNPASRIGIPTMILGADGDVIAPVGSFAQPFFNGLSADPDKALGVLRNANHFTFTAPNDVIAESTISWLKRFVDGDTRYDQFLCPAPSPSPAISSFRVSCPLI